MHESNSIQDGSAKLSTALDTNQVNANSSDKNPE